MSCISTQHILGTSLIIDATLSDTILSGTITIKKSGTTIINEDALTNISGNLWRYIYQSSVSGAEGEYVVYTTGYDGTNYTRAKTRFTLEG